MAETFRISKVLKYIENLRALRKFEFTQTSIFIKHLQEQFKEVLSNNSLSTLNDVNNIVDNLTEHSYKEKGIYFSHSQFSFFKETMFHMGATYMVDSIIKETGEFFDVDIPELNKTKSDLENYNIKSVDTKDYSNISRKFYIIVGGIGQSFSQQVQEECAQSCLTVLLKFIDANKISKSENGFIVQTPLQNIPNISNELIQNNIGIYGIIPVEEKE